MSKRVIKNPEDIMRYLTNQNQLELQKNKDLYVKWASEKNPEGLSILAVYFDEEFKSLASSIMLPAGVCDVYCNLKRFQRCIKNLNKAEDIKILFPPNVEFKDYQYFPARMILNLLKSCEYLYAQFNKMFKDFVDYVENVYIIKYKYTAQFLKKELELAKKTISSTEIIVEQSSTAEYEDLFSFKESNADDINELLETPGRNNEQIVEIFKNMSEEEVLKCIIKRENLNDIVTELNIFENDISLTLLIIHRLIADGKIGVLYNCVSRYRQPLSGFTNETYSNLRDYLFGNMYRECLKIICFLNLYSNFFEDVNVIERLWENGRLSDALDIIYNFSADIFTNHVFKLLKALKTFGKIVVFKKIFGYVVDILCEVEDENKRLNILKQIHQAEEGATIEILRAALAKLHTKNVEIDSLNEKLFEQKDALASAFIEEIGNAMETLEVLLSRENTDVTIKKAYAQFRNALSRINICSVYDIDNWVSGKKELYKELVGPILENKFQEFSDDDVVVVTSLGIKYYNAVRGFKIDK